MKAWVQAMHLQQLKLEHCCVGYLSSALAELAALRRPPGHRSEINNTGAAYLQVPTWDFGCRCRCMHEIMAVAALPEHDNIVGQYRAWQQDGHFYIQMDLCEGGSLAHLLEEVRGARCSWLGSSGQNGTCRAMLYGQIHGHEELQDGSCSNLA